MKVTEAPGFADFRIAMPDWPMAVLAESKRLSHGASGNTLHARLRKANNQIKAVGEKAFGIVILNATDLVSELKAGNGEVPSEISRIESWVQKLLSRHYTSISAAVIVWDELMVMGPEGPGRVVCVYLTTQSRVVLHLRPIHPLPDDYGSIGISGQLSFVIRPPDAPLVQSVANTVARTFTSFNGEWTYTSISGTWDYGGRIC